MIKERKYYRPNKGPHAIQGKLSLILAAASWIALAVLVIMSFWKDGNIGVYAGAIGLMIGLFSVSGVVYGIRGCFEEEHRHVMAVFGFLINGILCLGMAAIFMMGVL